MARSLAKRLSHVMNN